MANDIKCKLCGFTETDHHDVQSFPQIDPNQTYDKTTMYEKIVCREYDPDIKDGDLECTCTHPIQWCTGFCRFQ